MSDKDEKKRRTSPSKRRKRSTAQKVSPATQRMTLVKITGNETDEELLEIARQLHKQFTEEAAHGRGMNLRVNARQEKVTSSKAVRARKKVPKRIADELNDVPKEGQHGESESERSNAVGIIADPLEATESRKGPKGMKRIKTGRVKKSPRGSGKR